MKFKWVISAANDADQVGDLMTQIVSNSQAQNDNRARAIAFAAGTLGTTVTLSSGLNEPRLELGWQRSCPWTSAQAAAYLCGLYARTEGIGALCWDDYGSHPNDVWDFPAPRDPAGNPIAIEVNGALSSGLTPIDVIFGGRTKLVRRTTNYFLDANGNADFQAADASKVFVPDLVGEDCQVIIARKFAGLQIGDPPPAGKRNPANVVDKNMIAAEIKAVVKKYDAKGWVDDVGAVLASIQVERDVDVPTRFNCYMAWRTADNASQVGIRIAAVH
jgi:phage tail sheath gpL-like